MSIDKRVLLIEVPSLSYGLVQEHTTPNLKRLSTRGVSLPFIPSFPAVSTTVQASMTTGANPSMHGMVASGFYDRQRMSVSFSEPSDRLLESPRIWEVAKEQDSDFISAALFWENSVGASCDLVISPAPIQKRNGGFHSVLFSKPVELAGRLQRQFGNYKHSWTRGPFASARCTRWITRAAVDLLEDFQPNLFCLSLPHLAFAQIKSGNDQQMVNQSLKVADECLAEIIEAAAKFDYSVLVTGSYGMSSVNEAVYPNRYLIEHDLLVTHKVRGMEYVDWGLTRAFAVADHQVAHIYCDPHVVSETYTLLSTVPGIERILTLEHQNEWGIDHPRSGELILVAAQGYWFAYPWWFDPYQAPDFASKVDPFHKPGTDPLEYFWGAHPFVTSQDTSKVLKSHGRLPDDTASSPVLVANFPLETTSGPMRDTDVYGTILRQLGLEYVEPGFRT